MKDYIVDIVKDSIEKHKDDINNFNFAPVYEELDFYLHYVDAVKGFTELLYKSDINPMPYLTTIPSNFMYETDEFSILSIPDNVININQYAFSSCKDVKLVIIPDSVKHIGRGAFALERSSNRPIICNYKGSIYQWNNVDVDTYWFGGDNGRVKAFEKVVCTDGTVWI